MASRKRCRSETACQSAFCSVCNVRISSGKAVYMCISKCMQQLCNLFIYF